MSIFVLTAYLLTLATDMGVLHGLLGQESTDAFSRRLQCFLYATSETDLQYLPGSFTFIENTKMGDLWSCTLSEEHILYFIPTTNFAGPFFPLQIVEHAARAVLIVGIETKNKKGMVWKKNIDEKYGSLNQSKHKATASRQVFKRKVG